MKTVRCARIVALALIMLLVSSLISCDREEDVAFAQRPKDPPPVAKVSASAKPASGGMHWSVPPGWRELPAQQMRFAAFAVNDSNPPVEMTVIPLGPESAALLPNVNRWEKQLGLPESPEAKLPEIVKHISLNGLEANVVDLTGEKQRMLAAMVASGGRVWFFKLSGPVDVVSAQKSNFDAFIASLHADESIHPPAPTPAPTQLASHLANYKMPNDWIEIADVRPPRIKAFQAGGAEVAITQFAANNAGSFADNVTRWRGQLGLPPVEDPRTTPMKELTAGKDTPAVLLEFHNPDTATRMLVVMASAHGDLWFVKMTGPADAVDGQRNNFESFAKSLEFAGPTQPTGEATGEAK